MHYLIGFLYWTFFLVTLPIEAAGLVLLWLLTAWFDRNRAILHRYVCMFGEIYLKANPMWRAQVRNREKLPKSSGAILIANHASMVDILTVLCLKRPFKWVSKVENFRVPFIGLNLKLAKYVPVTRGNRDSVIEMMNLCEHWLARAVPVFFFPEGTRSKDGNLKPFKDGAFRLAMKVGCPVYPVVLHQTAKGLPKHGLIPKEKMNAVVEVLDPLKPGDFQSAEELRDKAQHVMRQALDRVPSTAAA